MPKNFFVTRDVTSVSGTQTFVVEADSYEDAARKVKEGKGELDSEEIEVTGLAKPCAVWLPDDRKATLIRR